MRDDMNKSLKVGIVIILQAGFTGLLDSTRILR